MGNATSKTDMILSKWGDGYGVRIPRSLLDEIGANESDVLRVTKADRRLVLEFHSGSAGRYHRRPIESYKFTKGEELFPDQPRGREAI